MAISGHIAVQHGCPLSGVERTPAPQHGISAFDPKRTFASGRRGGGYDSHLSLFPRGFALWPRLDRTRFMIRSLCGRETPVGIRVCLGAIGSWLRVVLALARRFLAVLDREAAVGIR